MGKYSFWVKKEEGIWQPVVADTNRKAHSQRSEITKSPEVKAVTAVRPISEPSLPMQLTHIIKKGASQRQLE